MNYENLKKEFIKLKKEELEYLDNIVKQCHQKTLSQEEKLNIYRKLKNYETKNAKFYILFSNIIYESKENDINKIIIKIKLKDDFFSKITDVLRKNLFLTRYNIDKKNNYILTVNDIIHEKYPKYKYLDFNFLSNNQELFEEEIYILTGYDDHSDQCFSTHIKNPDKYTTGIYWSISNGKEKEVPKEKIDIFEKDKNIIHTSKYVDKYLVKTILEEELLNQKNKTLKDCTNNALFRVNQLNYLKSPEYKEKVLLDKINKLYEKVKGKPIKKDLLYKENFINLIKEVYSLPNNKTITKEKIVKNNGKNSVIIIAKTTKDEYILTFQTRIKDKIIAEFPSGYIENNETFIDAAKRELKEETGFTSDTDNITLLEESYYSPGIDNSISYIIYMNNCIKAYETNPNENENITYGLFNEEELNYLYRNNIICGSLNKLAYYSLQNNVRKRVPNK